MPPSLDFQAFSPRCRLSAAPTSSPPPWPPLPASLLLLIHHHLHCQLQLLHLLHQSSKVCLTPLRPPHAPAIGRTPQRQNASRKKLPLPLPLLHFSNSQPISKRLLHPWCFIMLGRLPPTLRIPGRQYLLSRIVSAVLGQIFPIPLPLFFGISQAKQAFLPPILIASGPIVPFRYSIPSQTPSGLLIVAGALPFEAACIVILALPLFNQQQAHNADPTSHPFIPGALLSMADCPLP